MSIRRSLRKLPIPLRPVADWLVAKRGLALMERPPRSTNKEIYRCLRPDAEINIIFDVGANIGNVSRLYAGEFPRARIHAFEPVSTTYLQLARNTKDIPAIECHKVGVGETEGAASISTGPNSELNRIVASTSDLSETERIQIMDIDSFCARRSINRIDILKTDTEGYDLSVLKGARTMLGEGKISFIVTEVGFHKGDNVHTFFSSVFDFLSGFEFCFAGLYDIAYSDVGTISFANALFVRDCYLCSI